MANPRRTGLRAERDGPKETRSGASKDKPTQDMLITDRSEPRHAEAFSGINGPKVRKSKADGLGSGRDMLRNRAKASACAKFGARSGRPGLPKLCMEMGEPGCKESGTDAARSVCPRLRANRKEPMCKESDAGKAGPGLAVLRAEGGGPRNTLLVTGREDTKPALDRPNMRDDEPGRVCDRIEGEAPDFRKSKVDREGPRRARLRASKEDPQMTWSGAGSRESDRDTPIAKDAGPVQEKLFTEVGGPKCRESSTSKAGPVCTQLCNNMGKPRCAKSDTGTGALR